MPKVIGPVKKRGTGRRDYSRNVELSSIPQIRSYQEVAYLIAEKKIDAHATEELFSKTFEYAHFIFVIYITVDANVLISTKMTSKGLIMAEDRGYQQIITHMPASCPVGQLTVEVTNHSDISVDCKYTHFGVKGLEKMEPVFL